MFALLQVCLAPLLLEVLWVALLPPPPGGGRGKSLYLSIYLSIYLFIYLSDFLSDLLSIYLSIYRYIYISFYQSIYPLSICGTGLWVTRTLCWPSSSSSTLWPPSTSSTAERGPLQKTSAPKETMSMGGKL